MSPLSMNMSGSVRTASRPEHEGSGLAARDEAALGIVRSHTPLIALASDQLAARELAERRFGYISGQQQAGHEFRIARDRGRDENLQLVGSRPAHRRPAKRLLRAEFLAIRSDP